MALTSAQSVAPSGPAQTTGSASVHPFDAQVASPPSRSDFDADLAGRITDSEPARRSPTSARRPPTSARLASNPPKHPAARRASA